MNIRKMLILISIVIIPMYVNAAHMVRGYFRHNGTYVAPHMSMDPYESKNTGMSYHHNILVPNKTINHQQNKIVIPVSPSLPSSPSNIIKQQTNTTNPIQDNNKNNSKTNNSQWKIYY